MMSTVRPSAAYSVCQRRRAALSCLLALMTGTHRLKADEPVSVTDRCADAYEMTQRLRQRGELIRAHEQALFCAQAMCPALLRGDCISWSTEIEQSTPSVVIEVRRDDGKHVSDFEAFVDGRVVPEARQGRAFRIDPGPHRFRVTVPGGGVVERSEIIVQGVKNRILTLSLPPLAPDRGSAADEAGFPAATYILGGVALIGFGSFAFFGLRGRTRQAELDAQCGPSCSREFADPIARDYLIADVSLGVGLLATALGAWILIDANSSAGQTPRAASGVRVVPLASGAGLLVRQTF